MRAPVRWVRMLWSACAALALGTAAAHRAAAQAPNPPRPGLERLAALVQRRLGLTDEQAGRLRGVSARYARERQMLVTRERAARQVLREEVPRREGADQARVRSALDVLVEGQRRRAELVAREQRELAAFLTPVQRAQFLGLQERALRAAQRARRDREAPTGVGERAEPARLPRARLP